MTPRYGKLMESELHGDRTVFCYGDHYFDELHRKINYRVNCLPPSPRYRLLIIKLGEWETRRRRRWRRERGGRKGGEESDYIKKRERESNVKSNRDDQFFFTLPRAICLAREGDGIFLSWWYSPEIADSWLFSLWPYRLCVRARVYDWTYNDIGRYRSNVQVILAVFRNQLSILKASLHPLSDARSFG